MTEESYFKYWGKVEKAEEGKPLRYHLLPYHCLDVAAVVSVWWDSSPTIRRSFGHDANALESIRAWVLYFSSLHDYGKFDLRFQLKVPAVWQTIYPLSGQGLAIPSPFESVSYRHGENGLSWFKQDFFALCGCGAVADSLFLDESEPPQWAAWKPWIEAVTGHHGHVKKAEYVNDTVLPILCDGRFTVLDQTTRQDWLKALERLFLHPAGLSIADTPPEPSPLLAGLCSVADWLGSRCDKTNFSFQQNPAQLEEYFNRKVSDDAPRVFDFSGIEGCACNYGGIEKLLPSGVTPRPLQHRIDELPLETGLTIIEAPTGSGKTEAALAYAWRLLDSGYADSLIFALPTQATANAMLGRLEKLAGKLFQDSPNLLLAHGSARFNKEFANLKRRGQADEMEPDGWVQCGAWLAESRKRVFLGQIGVCTIDQVLISVLPVKHRFVRGFGVGRSVLIVDEVHAYDAYMYGLLEEVLRQQRAAGSSAILLSATLPGARKQKLCEAWQPGHEILVDSTTPYPLITRAGMSVPTFVSLNENEQPAAVEVNIECLTAAGLFPEYSLLDRVAKAAEGGVQVAVICNLVNDAQRVADKLRAISSAPVDLFHSRFRFKDRQAVEGRIINRYGPEGLRDKGRVLVATQVVEQSLDVDFDWLVTQLCPVDLLFQRLGRLHRHRRDRRPEGLEEPLCTILLPLDGDYGYTGKIYADTRVLWRTEQKLLAAPYGKIVFPSAYRDWIEPVYQEEAWGNEPEHVETGFAAYVDRVWQKHFAAKQMIQQAFEITPFSDSDEKVVAVTRDDEMGLTIIPYMNSPQGRRLLDGELVDAMEESCRAEELAMNAINVPARWGLWLMEVLEKDDEGRQWLEMNPKEGGFEREAKKMVLRYRRETGLERTK